MIVPRNHSTIRDDKDGMPFDPKMTISLAIGRMEETEYGLYSRGDRTYKVQHGVYVVVTDESSTLMNLTLCQRVI